MPDLGQNEWKESNNAAALDFVRNMALVLGAQSAALACGNLAVRRQEALQHFRVLIINCYVTIHTKVTVSFIFLLRCHTVRSI